MTKRLLMLLLCCFVLLAGCGGGNDTYNGGDKPWKLFSKEEAEKVLGFEVEEDISKIEGKLDQKIVFYQSASDDKSDFIQVSVVKNKEEADDAKEESEDQEYKVDQLFEVTKTTFEESMQSLEGFGDEAFWNEGALHILKGEYYVTVSTGHEDKPEYLERAKEIAEVIMGRL